MSLVTALWPPLCLHKALDATSPVPFEVLKQFLYVKRFLTKKWLTWASNLTCAMVCVFYIYVYIYIIYIIIIIYLVTTM